MIAIGNFQWETGSKNSNAERLLKERGIDFRYHFEKLEADIYGIGRWQPIHFIRLSGPDVWGIYVD